MTDLLLVLWCYVILQILALAGWPWLAAILRLRDCAEAAPDISKVSEDSAPPDLAFGLSKSLGLVFVAYVTWLLGFAGAPMRSPMIWLVWAIIAIAGFLVAGIRPSAIIALVRRHRRAILVGEAIFLVVFLALCRVRALTPDATFHIDEEGRTYDPSASEKFTNLALMTSLHRETTLPPRDTWLAGYPINYYYFGQFEWATFCKMAFIQPQIGFNIGQAALFALIAINAYSLVIYLTRRIAAGALAAYAIPIMGSMFGFILFLLEGVARYEFWAPSRVVEGTITTTGIAGPITEFPFFTFIVGDFHAHGISFHSFLLALAVTLFFPFGRKNGGRNYIVPIIITVVLLSLLLAVTTMTNTWDAPMLGLIIFVILTLRAFETRGLRCKRIALALGLSLLIAAIAVLMLTPHLLSFRVPVGAARDPGAIYIGPVKWLGASHLSEFKDYFVHFGFYFVPIVVAIHARLIARLCRSRVQIAMLGASYFVALNIFFFWQRFFLLYFLAAMIGYAIALVWLELTRGADLPEEEKLHAGSVWYIYGAIAALAAVGFFLSLFAELWVVEDPYEGPWERYNTIFKSYNIVWLLYGICLALVFAPWLPRVSNWRSLVQPGVLARYAVLSVFILMGFAYPYAAALARLREYRYLASRTERVALPAGPALDSTRYYAAVNRDEYALVEWIRENIEGKPVVAEACRLERDSYSVQSRIATFTGIRVVVAWPQHQMNWRSLVSSSMNLGELVPIRNELSQRVVDMQLLYTVANEQIVRQIIDRYKIEYIVIGRWERALHGPDAGAFLRKRFTPAFESGDTVFLKCS